MRGRSRNPGENGSARLPEPLLGHPRILPSHLRLVLDEARRRSAQDRQVGIQEHRVVGRALGGRMPGREDELRHARDLPAGCARARERALGPGGALFLGVGRSRVIDGVVEPEGELHLGGAYGEMARGVQVLEALREMPERVVGAVRLALAQADLLVEPSRRRETEAAPGCLPAIGCGHRFMSPNPPPTRTSDTRSRWRARARAARRAASRTRASCGPRRDRGRGQRG